MISKPVRLVLADDDIDDRMLFREALEELPLAAHLVTASDGVQLMELLRKDKANLPDMLFLDVNMPRKNGMECLTEIKQDDDLRSLPVIIYSTSFDAEMLRRMYETGAHHFIQKPREFGNLKKLILEAISLTPRRPAARPLRENFVIKV